MDYRQALSYLDSFVNYEKEKNVAYPEAFKLDRMRDLAKELGNPQNAYESVIIAGSKGKGSTAAVLSSILRMENYKVGLYTSPHLTDLRERIQVNGLWISEARLAEGMTRIQNILSAYAWRKNPPTYFEVLTALAFGHFKEMKVQVAVLEVGLGGLYDSTNIVSAKAAGIAPISLEHTDKLGKTVSKIAVQKCGVIKGREAVVSARQKAEVQSVIEDAAREREAEVFFVGRDIKLIERTHTEGAQRFDLRTPWGDFHDLELRLRGAHQLENAAMAVGLAKAMEKKSRLPVSDDAVKQGLLDARWPGRLEKISERPLIVLDGAHNAESIERMLAGLKRHFHFTDLVAVLGVSADKDLDGILKPLLGEAGCLICTQASTPRAFPAEALARKASESGKECYTEPEARRALQKAKALAEPDDLIVVTGSLFLVGEARSILMATL